MMYACLDDFCKKLQTIIESGNLWRDKSPATLMTLLRLYYPKDATDPRDKIYGLLGLVREWGSEQIQPDYTISHDRLYHKVALHSILVTKTLEFLAYKADKILEKGQHYQAIAAIGEAIFYYTPLPRNAGSYSRDRKKEAKRKGKPAPVELPLSSWVTDWGRINDLGYEDSVSERINRALAFDASGGRPALIPQGMLYTSDPALVPSAILPVSVFRVGKVLGKQEGGGDYSNQFCIHDNYPIKIDEDYFPLPMNSNKHLAQAYRPGGGTRYDAICRAICGDVFFNTSSSSADTIQAGSGAMFRRATKDDIKSVRLWRKWMHRGKTSEYGGYAPPDLKDFDDQEVYARVVEANRAIRSVGLLRRFVEVDSGHVGMVADAYQGDEIVVIMGARTAFAIREVGELNIGEIGKKMVHMIVGECYLVGDMDGQLVEKMEKEGKKPEEMYVV